ncbi:MAG: CoA transferase [Pseudonocardia sp.]|nr:CoA transferase [Pseudonocardia sp.]
MSASALSGLRVVDFSWSVAGPTITTLLAAAGAEVIRVEWPEHPDPMRAVMWAVDAPQTPDSACFFNYVNPGKKAFAVNARNPRGRALLESLISSADLVVESFSAGVMERWGLGYGRLRELREDIIYLSLSGFGHSGRYTTYDTWGPTAQAFNGITALSGIPGAPPAGWGFSYMDLSAGYMSTVALLAALHHRDETGEGQYVDVAQVETGLSMGGSSFLAASVAGPGTRPDGPPGNRATWPGSATSGRGETGAPYNLYPTRGGGRFDHCAITVLDDAQWRAFVHTLGDPDWARTRRFGTAAARVANQDELDRRVAEWTLPQDKYAVMERLQDAGVPAGALQSFSEILERDPQLDHRGVFATAEHPLLGERRWETFPALLSATPLRFHPTWPSLGKDSEHVLRDLLSLGPREIASLLDADVVRAPERPGPDDDAETASLEAAAPAAVAEVPS